MQNYYAVIMAGGVGSRFWPLSKEVLPKQFLDLLGTGETLLQKTYARLQKLVPEQNIFILTNDQYNELVKEELPQITDRQLVLEPEMRNTAPCILLSALKIKKENPNATMIIAPSDHWIEGEEDFAKDILLGFQTCSEQDLLLTLGIPPTQPHTGYGYIKYARDSSSPVKEVKRFTEKPDYYAAQSFYDSGNYLWNSGMFLGKADTLIKTYKTYLPEMADLFTKGWDALNTKKESSFLDKHYKEAENISIDYGVMEKAENVVVLPASFAWNDLGSWGSLYDKLPKDKDHNVIVNTNTYLEDSKGNIIHTPKGRIVVMKDLNDFIVVENEEVLLIYPKDKEQGIKEIRKKVQRKFGKELG